MKNILKFETNIVEFGTICANDQCLEDTKLRFE